MGEIDPWAGDRLQRRDDGVHLKKVLIERYRQRKEQGTRTSYILNIDASWGEGKSFFLNALRRDLSQDGHMTAGVNAWSGDLADDPLTTVIAALDSELAPRAANGSASAAYQDAKRKLGYAAVEITKQISFHALKKGLGLSINEISEAMHAANEKEPAKGASDKGEDGLANDLTKAAKLAAENEINRRIKSYNISHNSISAFKDRITATLSAIYDNDNKIIEPMFVFIDELDRCRPSFAIRMLEEAKHLFDIDEIVFVIATDSEQLSHAIRAVYGEGFEARKYLRRFFDRTFVFPEANRTEFIAELFNQSGISPDVFYAMNNIPVYTSFANWMRAFSVTNRDAEQCFDIVTTFVTSWPYSAKIEPNYLLLLIWSVYNSDWQNFNAHAAFSFGQDARLSRWNINVGNITMPDGAVQPDVKNAQEYLSPLGGLAYSTLPEAANAQLTVWRKFFASEYQNVYGNTLPEGRSPLSVIREYASRVRNAGRVVSFPHI